MEAVLGVTFVDLGQSKCLREACDQVCLSLALAHFYAGFCSKSPCGIDLQC